MEDRGLSAYLAEFIGTFLLVLFISAILAVNSSGGIGGTDFAVIGLLHAFALMMLVYSLGGTSGAHFNPAVTVALAALRKISPLSGAVYIVVQIAGGVAGAAVTKLIMHDLGNATHLGAPAPSQIIHGKTFTASLVELIGTFVLMWAIMATAVNPRGQRAWAGWVIGATLGFAVMTFAPLTGAGFNPARSLGPAAVANAFGSGGGRFAVIYLVAPVVGALLAAVGYKLVVLDPQERVGERPIDKLA